MAVPETAFEDVELRQRLYDGHSTLSQWCGTSDHDKYEVLRETLDALEKAMGRANISLDDEAA